MSTKPANAPPLLCELPDALTGSRVLVRPLRVGDGAALWEAIDESRQHIRPWLPWVDETRCPSDSESHARRSQAKWLLREDLAVGIWHRETGQFLGGSGLHPKRWEVPAFEIGYWLRRSAEGHGYISEAVRLLCGLGFETLGANRISICCDARNLRSAAVPRRLGFQHEATLRNEHRDTEGNLRDTLIFTLTPEAYAAAKLNNAQWRD